MKPVISTTMEGRAVRVTLHCKQDLDLIRKYREYRGLIITTTASSRGIFEVYISYDTTAI